MTLRELIAKLQAIEAVEGGDIDAALVDPDWARYWRIGTVEVAAVNRVSDGDYGPAALSGEPARIVLLDT